MPSHRALPVAAVGNSHPAMLPAHWLAPQLTAASEKLWTYSLLNSPMSDLEFAAPQVLFLIQGVRAPR